MFPNTKIRKIWAYTLFQTLPVGYICKGLLDSQVISGGGKGRNTPNQELSK